MQNKVGILGGTFNPIHSGHLYIAKKVYRGLRLSKIIFIPSAFPPHKDINTLISAKHRHRMLSLAIRSIPFFEISDIEIRSKRRTYTVNTIRSLKKLQKSSKLYFIIGTDSLKEISTWKNASRIFNLCTVVVVDRPGYSFKEIQQDLINEDNKWRNIIKKIKYVRIKPVDVASTWIRNMLKEKSRLNKIKKYLPSTVVKYIKKNKLYAK